MDPGYYTLIGLVAVGLAYGLRRARKPDRGSRGAGIALGILAVLMLGLYIASRLGNEMLTWLFGLSLMVALPIMMFLSVGSAIGKRLGRAMHKEEDQP